MYSRKISAGYDCMIHDNKQIGKSFFCSWADLRLQKENLRYNRIFPVRFTVT